MYDENVAGAALSGITIRFEPGVGDFTRAEWSALGGTARDDATAAYNPFVSYDFLCILEESGCAVRETGWQGHHLRMEGAKGDLLGDVAQNEGAFSCAGRRRRRQRAGQITEASDIIERNLARFVELGCDDIAHRL